MGDVFAEWFIRLIVGAGVLLLIGCVLFVPIALYISFGIKGVLLIIGFLSLATLIGWLIEKWRYG